MPANLAEGKISLLKLVRKWRYFFIIFNSLLIAQPLCHSVHLVHHLFRFNFVIRFQHWELLPRLQNFKQVVWFQVNSRVYDLLLVRVHWVFPSPHDWKHYILHLFLFCYDRYTQIFKQQSWRSSWRKKLHSFGGRFLLQHLLDVCRHRHFYKFFSSDACWLLVQVA